MANYNKSGDIAVEQEFNNIFVANPNKIYGDDGTKIDRYVKQEELIMYANLEANIQPRSRLLISDSGDVDSKLIATSNINFLKPNNQEYLSTSWTNLNTTNQRSDTWNPELLGITNISYSVNTSFTSKINITLEDVQGRALFEPGDQSIYAAFFNLPYPIFYLTLKGYYGKAIRYPLLLQTFNASLRQETGNFQINLTFISYKFTILTDIMQSDLIALPHMYFKNNQSTTTLPVSQTSGEANKLKEIGNNSNYGGSNYLKEVYDEYKKLGVINKDFPIMTVPQLLLMLENLTTDTLKQFGQENADDITNLDNYSNVLSEYKNKVYAGADSWFEYNTNQKDYFVNLEDVPNGNGRKKKVKYYKANSVPTSPDIQGSLKSLISEYNYKLIANPTLGDGGVYSFKKLPSYGNVATFSTDTPSFEANNEIIIATLKERLNKETFTDAEKENLKNELFIHMELIKNLNEQLVKDKKDPVPLFYRYEGKNGIKTILSEIEKNFPTIKDKLETELTDKFVKLLESPKGLGFKPTIRNISAVILASSEAFLRIMNDVHAKAFTQRNSEDRIKSVTLTSVVDRNEKINNSPVFPWPQFTVEEKDSKGDIKYVVSYPADPKYVDYTNGDDYNIWPETEFVEQYIKGLIQRTLPQGNPNIPDSGINKFLIAGYDTPPTNTPYSNLEILKFFYELYERLFAISLYQGYIREEYDDIMDILTDSELNNVLVEIIGADNILNQFKTIPFNTITLFKEYLNTISNGGTGKYWQNSLRGIINTEYLDIELSESLKVLSDDLPPINLFNRYEKTLEKYLKNKKTNKIYFTDLYPFISKKWISENLPNGNNNNLPIETQDTTKSLFYNTTTKKISNYISSTTFGSFGDKMFNRPITDFSILTNTPSLPLSFLGFYELKTNLLNPNYSLTELKLNYSGHSGNLTDEQTTSLLNTPYFINALLEGVDNKRSGEYYPFISAAYLFLQSLPYATLKEKYRTKTTLSIGDEKNFIASTIKKFGSVHSLPKLWVLKLGSIWHRYKKHNNENIDILDNCWTDFNQNYNFDPVDSNPNKQYTFVDVPDGNGGTINSVNITLQTQVINNGITTNLMNVGFYPKVINDIYYLIYDTDLYTDNTQIQASLQNAISKGEVFIYSPQEPSINSVDYNSTNESLNLKTWSVAFYNSLFDVKSICPSFGSVTNQVKEECFTGLTLSQEVYNNQSVFNGSVRTMWGLSNYGFFENSIIKPSPSSYFKVINNKRELQDPGNLIYGGEYANIEEIFTLFTKKELDILETEFLEFCKIKYNTKNEFNFQSIISNILAFDVKLSGSSQYNIVKDIQDGHNRFLTSRLTEYVNNNTILKLSNPSHFDLQSLNYFTSSNTGTTIFTSTLGDIEKYKDVTPNALPYDGGTILLADSYTNYPEVWKTMREYVGFSTVSSLTYSNSGSYITDFFIDNNIAFTTGNTITFQNVIKIYASRKLSGEITDKDSFVKLVKNYFVDVGRFQNIYYNDLYGKIRGSISNLTQNKNKKSDMVGESSKVEFYDRFKAINDKWISGNNYKKILLFSDFLFLDRASRDIGDKVILDVFKIKKWLGGNESANIETIIRSIYMENNFVVMSLPAYVNFYGVPTPTGSDSNSGYTGSEFANYLFKNYTEVDYQDSRNKLVCFYSPPPSSHLDVKTDSGDLLNGYNDDGLKLQNPTNNPVNESQQDKKDFALSNKVVGFYVDFGLQNQSVFKNFSIQQDIGKSTSESVKMLVDMRNQKDGTKSATQDVSLFNIYKLRSYQAEITSFGNAMIQPMMYFVLRNVPLFAGSYLIQSVRHTVTDGNFETVFTGTRQRITEYPIENIFLQTLKTSLMSNVKALSQKQTTNANNETNIINSKNEITNSIIKKKEASSNQNCVPIETFSFFTPATPTEIVLSFIDIRDAIINSGIPQDKRKIIFTLFYLESTVKNNVSLSCFNYNFAGIPLTFGYGGNLSDYLQPNYTCLMEGETTTPYAIFPSLNNCILFVNAKFANGFKSRIVNINDAAEFVVGFCKGYIEIFPNIKPDSDKFYQDYITTNQIPFDNLQRDVARAYLISNSIGL